MFEKIPPDRRIFLAFAIGVGVVGGYFLKQDNPTIGMLGGAGIAVFVVFAVLSAASGGDMNALLNAVRGVTDGMRPAKPAGLSGPEAAVYDALDALAQKVSTVEQRAKEGERTGDERRSELDRVRLELDRYRS